MYVCLVNKHVCWKILIHHNRYRWKRGMLRRGEASVGAIMKFGPQNWVNVDMKVWWYRTILISLLASGWRGDGSTMCNGWTVYDNWGIVNRDSIVSWATLGNGWSDAWENGTDDKLVFKCLIDCPWNKLTGSKASWERLRSRKLWQPIGPSPWNLRHVQQG